VRLRPHPGSSPSTTTSDLLGPGSSTRRTPRSSLGADRRGPAGADGRSRWPRCWRRAGTRCRSSSGPGVGDPSVLGSSGSARGHWVMFIIGISSPVLAHRRSAPPAHALRPGPGVPARSPGILRPCPPCGWLPPSSTPSWGPRRQRPPHRRRPGGGHRGRSRPVRPAELAVTGYPPEDLLLKPGFVDDATAALHQVARRLPGVSLWSASWSGSTRSIDPRPPGGPDHRWVGESPGPWRPSPWPTRRPCAPAAGWSASTTSASCPTTACSTRNGGSPRARAVHAVLGGRDPLRGEHLRGRVVPDGPVAAQGRAGASLV